MKSKNKKILNFICAIIVLLTTLLPDLGIITSEVYASSATIQYNGKATYNGNTVGDFTVNGEQAFCMEHVKSTPGTGTAVTSNVYEDENIAKCLYYRLCR